VSKVVYQRQVCQNNSEKEYLVSEITLSNPFEKKNVVTTKINKTLIFSSVSNSRTFTAFHNSPFILSDGGILPHVEVQHLAQGHFWTIPDQH